MGIGTSIWRGDKRRIHIRRNQFRQRPHPSSFFKDEFGECAIYYNAELIYPHYRFSLADLYKALASVFKNERLYFSKINCLVERNQVTL
ncbi:hypothetical protein AVT97_gp35 [Sulfolobales Virus YNP2]|uniref:hypothetical protein n=1 Tax=Sulfolobales Virus YNP2 TaxID=1732180 RepID=UPI000705CAF2|nr:hypothetical protein AVT97_gp35 [Sulfolobales Virus YNP2]ALG97198.1 hypothetical protein [Sulfolobales Virus YNP2]